MNDIIFVVVFCWVYFGKLEKINKNKHYCARIIDSCLKCTFMRGKIFIFINFNRGVTTEDGNDIIDF